MQPSDRASVFREAVKKSRNALWGVALLSCAVNILMLTGPLFMLQVYDRVLTSGSVPTLVALFAIVAMLFLFLGVFDLLRTRILSRTGFRLETELMVLAKKIWVASGLVGAKVRIRPLADITTVRQFLSSNGLPALFDLPWVPVYLAIVFLLHTWLGLLATAGAVLVISATILNEFITKKHIMGSALWEQRDFEFAEMSNRNADAITSMGMVGQVTAHWQGLRYNALASAQRAGSRTEIIATFTKAVRMLVQSAILALGAYLAIHQEISAGTMIAASILAGRALTPVDMAVGNWKNIIKSRQAFARLHRVLGSVDDVPAVVDLPAPKARLNISNVFFWVPGNDAEAGISKPILKGLNFKLEPGDGLGVIGPSASGKSTLARLLVGIAMPQKGTVRFDGATFDQWDGDKVGRHIGYLPQNAELMAGTIQQNIARFSEDISDEQVVEAAKLAGVHELILELPGGYATEIANGGHTLSGGQIQRIALARAVLLRPALVVLDEPNSNLDSQGDAALAAAIETLRNHGSCVVVMAHRPSAIAAVNKVLMLKNGAQMDFGAKQEVLNRVTQSGPKLAVAQ